MNKKNRIEQMPRRRYGGTYNDSLGQGPSVAEQAAKAAEQARKDYIKRRTVNATYEELSCEKGVNFVPGARYAVEIRPKRTRTSFEGEQVKEYDAVEIYVPDGRADTNKMRQGDNTGLTSKPCGSTSLWDKRDGSHPNRGLGTEFIVFMNFDEFINNNVTGVPVEWKSGNGNIGHLNTLKGVFTKVGPSQAPPPAASPAPVPPPPPAPPKKAAPPPPPKKAAPPPPPKKAAPTPLPDGWKIETDDSGNTYYSPTEDADPDQKIDSVWVKPTKSVAQLLAELPAEPARARQLPELPGRDRPTGAKVAEKYIAALGGGRTRRSRRSRRKTRARKSRRYRK